MQVTSSTHVEVNHNALVRSCELQLNVPGHYRVIAGRSTDQAICEFVGHLLCLSSRAYTGVCHMHTSQACKHHPFLLVGEEQPCPPLVSEYHTASCLQVELQTALTACWRLTVPAPLRSLVHTVERR